MTRHFRGFFKFICVISFVLMLSSVAFGVNDRSSDEKRSIGTETGGVYNVREFGARGDGRTKDTKAIQNAIDASSASGGGTVFLPAGTYLSGSLYLRSNIDFHLGADAVLLGSPDPTDYNPVNICPQNRASALEHASGTHLLLCIEQKNVTVRGPGIINGNCRNCTYLNLDKNGVKLPGHAGIKWRPSQMLYFVESENVNLRDLELVDSPYWSCFIYGCIHVNIEGVRIKTRRGETHNGDGIDIDACEYVTVSNCNFNTSDDSLTLRANSARLKKPRPCRYVTVRNCVLSSGQACIRIGVGDGKISDAVFSNLVFEDSNMGICLCPGWGTTGTDINNIRFDDISVSKCGRLFMLFFFCKTPAKIENIYFSRISGSFHRTSMLLGTKRDTVRNLCFSDIDLYSIGKKDVTPLEAHRIDGLRFSNMHLNSPEGAAVNSAIRIGAVNGLTLTNSGLTVKKMTDSEIAERDNRPPMGY